MQVGIEVLGTLLVPILLFILNNIRKDVRENRRDIKEIKKHLKNNCYDYDKDSEEE